MASEFVVDSKGHCFLCLEHVSSKPILCKLMSPAGRGKRGHGSSSSSLLYPLQCLFRYLKMDRGNETGSSTLKELMGNVKESRVKVSLCQRCAGLYGAFSELYQQLEQIDMKVGYYLKLIQGELLKAEESVLTEVFRTSDGMHSAEELKILEGLRNEVIQTGSIKLANSPPRVHVHNMTTEEVFDSKLNLILNSGSNAAETPAFEATNIKLEFEDNCENYLDDFPEPQNSEAIENAEDDEYNRNLQPPPIIKRGRAPKRPTVASTSIKNASNKLRKLSRTFRTNPHTGKRQWTKEANRNKNENVPLAKGYGNDHWNLDYKMEDVWRDHCSINGETGGFKCLHCPKTFSVRKTFQDHYTGIHLKLKYKCNQCPKEFIYRSSYHIHHKAAHMNCGFRCQHCHKRFTETGLAQHRRKSLRCQGEGETTPSLEDDNSNPVEKSGGEFCLDKATKAGRGGYRKCKPWTKNTETGNYICSLCTEEFSTYRKYYSHHDLVHLKIRYKCEICEKEFTQKSGYQIHLKSVHMGVTFKCEKCDAIFRQRSNLVTHQRIVNCQQKKNPDKVEDSVVTRGAFPELSGVDFEDMNHSVDWFQPLPSPPTMAIADESEGGERTATEIPEPPTKSPTGRTRKGKGKRRKITTGSPRKVKRADKTITNSPHVPRKRPGSGNTKKKPYSLNTETRKYTCTLCSEEFPTYFKFDKHYDTIHLNIKYTCETCGEEFTHKKSYKNHLASAHTDKFKCEKCSAIFKQRSFLISHQRKVNCLHKPNRRGRKPRYDSDGKNHPKGTEANMSNKIDPETCKFECILCSKEFTEERLFQRHYQRSHSNRRFKCLPCGKIYRFEATYNRHQREVHEQEDIKPDVETITASPTPESYEMQEGPDDDITSIPEVNTTTTTLPTPNEMQEWLERDTTPMPVNPPKKKKRVPVRVKTEKKDDTLDYGTLNPETENPKCHQLDTTYTLPTTDSKEMQDEPEQAIAPMPVNLPKKRKRVRVPVKIEKNDEDTLEYGALNPQTGYLKCHQCPKEFKHKYGLNSHYKSVHTNHRYRCIPCGKSYRRRHSLKQHFRIDHKGARLTCEKCGESFRLKTGLANHLRKTSCGDGETLSRKHPCPLCSKRFNTKGHLTVHLRGVHSKERNHICDHCGKGFLFRKYLQIHSKKYHNVDLVDVQTEEGPSTNLIADGEDGAFTLDNEPEKVVDIPEEHLDDVVVLEEPNNLPIPVGKYSYEEIFPERLPDGVAPMGAVHIPETGKFRCNACPLEFAYESLYQIHYKSVHLKVRYKCKLCAIHFAHPGSIRRHHASVHMGVRFKCKVCKKLFSDKDKLRTHLRVISCGVGKAPEPVVGDWVCDICGKSYRLRQSLKSHTQACHGENSEDICDICGKTFSGGESMYKHKRYVHGVGIGQEKN